MVDTGISIPVGSGGAGYRTLPDGTLESNNDIFIADFRSATGENFDLNDIFFPNNLSKKSIEAISKNGIYLTQKAWCIIRTEICGGLFGFWLQDNTKDTTRPYALVKYV